MDDVCLFDVPLGKAKSHNKLKCISGYNFILLVKQVILIKIDHS